MATRTDNAITLTKDELSVVLEALHDCARHNYVSAANKRSQQAIRDYSKRKADSALTTRDAIVRRMYTWS